MCVYLGILMSLTLDRCKMLRKSFRLIFVFIFFKLILNSSSHSVHNIYPQQNDTVILGCIDRTEAMSKWKHENDLLFLGRNALTSNLRYAVPYSDNYSLSINPIMLADEGIFECIGGDSTTIETYNLTVTVPANTFVAINGKNATDLMYVEETTKSIAVCYAKGSKPVAEFSWMLNGYLLNNSNAKVNISPNSRNNLTFDATSTIEYRPYEITGNITCLAEGAGWRKQQASVRFATFVNPKIYLSINDVRNENEVSMVEDEKLNIVCSATGARPRVKLAIKINNKYVEILEEMILPSVDNFNRRTFDTKVEVSFVPPGKNGTITCETTGQVLQESFVYAVYFKKGEKDNDMFLMALILSGASVCVFLVAVLCIYKCCKGPKETKANVSSLNANKSSVNYQIDDEYLIPALNGSGMTDPFSSTDRQGFSSLENRLTILNLDSPGPLSECAPKGTINTKCDHGNLEKFLGITSTDFEKMNIQPPGLELPDLPLGDDLDYGDYTTLPDNVYYSKSIAEGAQGKIYQRKDLCFIVNMKKGHVYDRWMGTIAIPNESNKCVVISTLTDKLLRTKEIHWDVYVKGLLELPAKATNIARCEGICIDSGHLFLLQEHLTCESLKTHIETNCSTTNSNVKTDIDPIRLAHFCVDTVGGLECLHSYGFLHPGLSTKKILLTSEGVCKLYDFCLSDDASATVIIVKAKNSLSLNMLAPESIRRNEYSRESDMWAIAVVIWEIINFGDRPFPEDEGKASVCNIESKRPMNWPHRHFPFRNKSLIFDCWSEDVARRPALKLLKDAFEEVLDPTISSDTGRAETNIYSSMGENMN